MLTSLVQDPEIRAQRIASDLEFRRDFYFPADQATVEALYDALPDVDGTLLYGALLTADEANEMGRRAALEADAAEVDLAVEELGLQAAYAGPYIDHESGGTLVVGFIEGTENLDGIQASLREVVAQPDALRVQSVAHGLDELERVKAAVSAAMQADQLDEFSVVSVGLDVSGNRIDVGITDERDLAGVERQLREAFGSGAIVATATMPPGPTSLNNDNDVPPVHGGHRWQYASDTGTERGCTLGLPMVRNGTGNPDWILSAGHCVNNAPIGDKVYHSDTLIGVGSSRSFGGTRDFGLIKLGDDGTDHKIYHFYSNTVEITGSSTENTDGAPRCYTGRFSGTECGTILDPSFDAYYQEDDTYVDDLVRVSPNNITGDSGGPAYQTVTYGGVIFTVAFGVISGHTGNGDTLYAKIGNIPSSWDVTVREQP